MKFCEGIYKKIDKFLLKNSNLCLSLDQKCNGPCSKCEYNSSNCMKEYDLIINNIYITKSRSTCINDINNNNDCEKGKSCNSCFNEKLMSFGLKIKNKKLESVEIVKKNTLIY